MLDVKTEEYYRKSALRALELIEELWTCYLAINCALVNAMGRIMYKDPRCVYIIPSELGKRAVKAVKAKGMVSFVAKFPQGRGQAALMLQWRKNISHACTN